MVLGLRSKTRKGDSVQVDYLVTVQEIKPWPPSQSLRSVQSLLLQWENGDQNIGSLSSVAGDGNIVFNVSFELPVTLCREKRVRDNFQKNCLEFYLYESRKDKAVKGQLLGTAIINLADYGIIKENIFISALVNCKKSSRNAAQPVLYISVQPLDKDSSNPSPKGMLSKEVSLDKDGVELVSELMNAENADQSEIASFTDDDVSSHSSRTFSSVATEAHKGSSSHNKKVDDGNWKTQENVQQSVRCDDVDKIATKATISDVYMQVNTNFDLEISGDSQAHGDGSDQVARHRKNSQLDTTTLVDSREKIGQQVYGHDLSIMEEKRDPFENKLVDLPSQLATGKHTVLRSETLTSNRRVQGMQDTTRAANKLKKLNSVQLPFGSSMTNGLSGENENKEKVKEVHGREHVHKMLQVITFDWKSKVDTLEEELREAAVLEVALYSVVAEHGSSTNKVHAPARRLSRFYLHSCKSASTAQKGNAARAVVSGLILVSKSCGNDVPRLTFWLSNSIMLRAIVDQVVQETQHSKAPNKVSNVSGKGPGGKSTPKRDNSLSTNKEKMYVMQQPGNWENPQIFALALEKVEAWIFSRIIESIWWQTLTPHMQSTVAKTNSRSSSSRRSKNALGDQEQGSFSVELWKKAFKDACERLCPIRAGGHECGCLPVLARLVMEQLVDRLDIAMFNAILRESAEEMPTDPVSDPISDPKVLPIPAGKASFGAGAQLKNAIGNWSRWLTDLFGIDDNDSPDDENNHDDSTGMECGKSFKPFRLLNVLSDLMMLPIDMLADSSTRKEVCPMFGPLFIKRILYNFVPDEFSPEPIPAAVLEALDNEDAQEATGELANLPCSATPTVYSPPPSTSLAGFVGEVGSQTPRRSVSILRKSYTSDDELDELDSPLTSITIDSSRVSLSSVGSIPTPEGGRQVVRYKLLREVWRDDD
ncbi:hypothetical protein NMG60_11030897 [Bertholletia excelsa]